MRDITCRDMVAVLDGYVAGDLKAVYTREIDGHLDGCRDCGVFLDTSRTTITLTAQLRLKGMPEDFREKLRDIAARIITNNGAGEC